MVVTMFQMITGSFLQVMGVTVPGVALYITLVCCDWCVSIQALFSVTMFPQVSGCHSLVFDFS